MIVTFRGHREFSQEAEVRKWLFSVIEELIQSGEKEFWHGGYGAFDSMAASVVWELKQKYPYIKSVLVLPYLNKKICITKYDETLYPDLENVLPRYAISYRNRWMMEKADVVVAFVQHDWGGAAQTLKYAIRKQKRIIQYEF